MGGKGAEVRSIFLCTVPTLSEQPVAKTKRHNVKCRRFDMTDRHRESEFSDTVDPNRKDTIFEQEGTLLQEENEKTKTGDECRGSTTNQPLLSWSLEESWRVHSENYGPPFRF